MKYRLANEHACSTEHTALPLRQVHNMTLDIALPFVACTLIIVAIQCNVRIVFDAILAFPALCPPVWSQKKKIK